MRYDGPKARVSDITIHGIRTAEALCHSCHHRATFELSRFQPNAVFVEIAARLVCQTCGAKGKFVSFMPNWHENPGAGRMLPSTSRA